MGSRPDHQALATEALGMQTLRLELARRLVAQALVRRGSPRGVGGGRGAIVSGAPQTPGVYTSATRGPRSLCRKSGQPAARGCARILPGWRWRGLKRRLRASRRCGVAGSRIELEALLLEARLIHELAPEVNVQTGEPALDTRVIPSRARS